MSKLLWSKKIHFANIAWTSYKPLTHPHHISRTPTSERRRDEKSGGNSINNSVQFQSVPGSKY